MSRQARLLTQNDDGCEYAPVCLECPFPTCIEDGRWSSWRTCERSGTAEMREAVWAGLSIAEAAARYGVTERAIHRRMRMVYEGAG